MRADLESIGGLVLGEVLGRGGMGIVHAATGPDGRRLAVKLIIPQRLADVNARARFEREVRLAATIQHPHVVGVHGGGTEDGQPYLVMDRVDGTDLEALVAEHGPVHPAWAALIVAQVGEALDTAHARELVHRDVKPQNVLLAAGEGEPRALLSDFGLARATRRRCRASPQPASSSAPWTSPRPSSSRASRSTRAPTSTRSDACSPTRSRGRSPSLARATWTSSWRTSPTRRRCRAELEAGLPPALDAVVARAMEKEPGERFASAGDLGRAALDAAAGGPPPPAWEVRARREPPPDLDRGAATAI